MTFDQGLWRSRSALSGCRRFGSADDRGSRRLHPRDGLRIARGADRVVEGCREHRSCRATASRLRAGKHVLEPTSKPYELALLLVRLFRSLDAVVGGDEPSLQSWMVTKNLALNAAPRDLVQTAAGLVAVVDYVDTARARV